MKEARIYSYGCCEPTLNFSLAVDQLRLANRYRNALVELERNRRERVLAETRREFPRLVELEAALESIEVAIATLDAQIKANNAAERRKRATPQQQTEKQELRERRAALYAELREVKQDAYGPHDVVELRTNCRAANKQGNVAEVARLEGELVGACHVWHARIPQAERLRESLDAIDAEILERQKQLRANCNLYWGNYLCVEDAAKTFRKGAPPEFSRYTGEGRLGVQIQGGMTPQELRACEDQRIKLELLPEGSINRPSRKSGTTIQTAGFPHHNRRRRRANLWVRVGSTDREVLIGGEWVVVAAAQQRKTKQGVALVYTLADGTTGTAQPGGWRGESGSPIWCVIPLVYHRDIPENASIKQVYVHRIKTGNHYRWKASFVLSSETGFPRVCKPTGEDAVIPTGNVAINLGWRVMTDGSLRVAYWQGEDGKRGELLIPQDRIAALWEKPKQIQEIRSRLLTEAITRLAGWIDDHEELIQPSLDYRLRNRQPDGNYGPRSLRQWRSSYRLAALVEWWRYNRFVGDEEIFGWLEGWQVANPNGNGKPHYIGFRRQEKHLCDWENNLRDRATNWRKNLYREFAVMLSKRYQTVLIADVNWRQLNERPDAECNESENVTAKFNARVAAPGIMEEVLRNRFADVVSMDAANLTQTCSECGRLDPFDAVTELYRMCRHCGEEVDQDRRHCRNLLRVARGEAMNETTAPTRIA